MKILATYIKDGKEMHFFEDLEEARIILKDVPKENIISMLAFKEV